MTDQLYGLGAIPSPFDERDYPISALYEAMGIIPETSFPSEFASTPVPPILNQGEKPQCTCYGTAGMKMYQDYADQSPARWFDFDEDLMFSRVNGGPNGAVVRDVLDQMYKVGYPLKGNATAAKDHMIAGYFAVPVTESDIKAALTAFGEIVFGISWANSYFSPNGSGVLPKFDWQKGGHLVRVRGWKDGWGFRIPNSWGTAWGADGECYLPYSELSHVFEVWKAPDQPAPPPPPPSLYHWHVAAHGMVKVYQLDPAGDILPGWTTTAWGARSSSAPCTKPVFRVTADGKSHATTVRILSGAFAGKTVGVAPPDTSVS